MSGHQGFCCECVLDGTMGQAASPRLPSSAHRLWPVGPVRPGPAGPSLTSRLSLSALLSGYAGLLLVSRRHTFLPDGPLSVASLMPLLYPFLLAAPPPSGCNLNLTSEKRSCQITLPKVVPFPLFLTSAPKSYFSSAFPSFNYFMFVYLSSAYPNPRVC